MNERDEEGLSPRGRESGGEGPEIGVLGVCPYLDELVCLAADISPVARDIRKAIKNVDE